MERRRKKLRVVSQGSHQVITDDSGGHHRVVTDDSGGCHRVVTDDSGGRGFFIYGQLWSVS